MRKDIKLNFIEVLPSDVIYHNMCVRMQFMEQDTNGSPPQSLHIGYNIKAGATIPDVIEYLRKYADNLEDFVNGRDND